MASALTCFNTQERANIVSEASEHLFQGFLAPVTASGELPLFDVGERVRIDDREPIGHYRVPLYLRGKSARVESVIEPVLVDNEAEGFGRNAGSRLHYYRLALLLKDLWPHYAGHERDELRVEVVESWLKRT